MSLVIELQSLAQNGATDVVELVRRAKTVAAKLRLKDFEKLLDLELSGYPSHDVVPEYRKVGTVLVSHNPYHGTHDVQWPEASGGDSTYDHFSRMGLREPIAALSALVAKADSDQHGSLIVNLTPPELSVIVRRTRAPRGIGFSRRLDLSAVHAVLDAVRVMILNWALQLESENILGDGMTFSLKEKAQAQQSQTINNYGTLLHGDYSSIAQAQSSPGASVAVSSGEQAELGASTDSTEHSAALVAPKKSFMQRLQLWFKRCLLRARR